MWTIGSGSICIGYFDFESVSIKVYFIKVYFFTVYATFSALVCGLLEVAVYALVIGHRLSTLTQPS